MKFALSPDQNELRKLASKMFSEASSAGPRVQSEDPEEDYDPGLWASMAESGLLAIDMPEEAGGQALKGVETAVLMEQMGRTMVCSPYFGSVTMAARALQECAPDSQEAVGHLQGIGRGELQAALVVDDGFSFSGHGSDQLVVEAVEGGHVLTGTVEPVVDGATADVLVCPALVEGELGLFIVRTEDPSVRVQRLRAFDPTRKLARITFAEAPANQVARGGQVAAGLNTTLAHVRVAMANEAVGLSAFCLDSSVEYSKVREQFGRPIGSFQAVKHMCAEMFVEVESSRALAWAAAWYDSVDADDLGRRAAQAKARCTRSAVEVASTAIQVHGGIGFTWEHPLHYYLKRAKASSLLYGTGPDLRAEVAARYQLAGV